MDYDQTAPPVAKTSCCCSGQAKTVAAGSVKDLVCGMTVDPATAKHQSTHDDQPYFFCSAGCKSKFEADPSRYLKPELTPAPSLAANAIYTCPMHP